MRVSYNKLWKLLIDKGMKKMDLLEAIEMNPNTLAKLGRKVDFGYIHGVNIENNIRRIYRDFEE